MHFLIGLSGLAIAASALDVFMKAILLYQQSLIWTGFRSLLKTPF